MADRPYLSEYMRMTATDGDEAGLEPTARLLERDRNGHKMNRLGVPDGFLAQAASFGFFDIERTHNTFKLFRKNQISYRVDLGGSFC